MTIEDWQAGGFGLYVHWPFCTSKCPYCDFNSHVATKLDDRAWAAAYVSEINRLAAETPGRVLNTIYFGGGTPSLMQPDTVAEVIAAATSAWSPANDIEITLEANPGSVEREKFRHFRAAGVNRVSLGIQALNDTDLARLGRTHTAAEARAALSTAREVFSRVSFDLIYARQDQTQAGWQAELRLALTFLPDHLSLYQLTIEDGTVFGRRFAAGQLRGLPGEDQAADMYGDTRSACSDAGLIDYEVSNYAIAGHESRHNLLYWRSGDYLGVGPGAHGRLTKAGQRFATVCPKAPGDWLNRVSRQGNGELARELLNGTDRAEEFLLMGLRLSEGVDLGRFERLAGQPIPPQKIQEMTDLGMIQVTDQQLAATPQGRLVLNRLLLELLA